MGSEGGKWLKKRQLSFEIEPYLITFKVVKELMKLKKKKKIRQTKILMQERASNQFFY